MRRVTIGFGFTSDWMKKWHEFLSQSGSGVDAKPITFRRSNENRSIALAVVFNERRDYSNEFTAEHDF